MNWKTIWKDRSFLRKLLSLFLVFIGVLFCFPYFFQYQENRLGGRVLNDPLLDIFPAIDCSIPIFVIIWAVFIILLIRCIQNPQTLLIALATYVLISISRFITIYLTHLAPPADLIPLIDPIVDIFYGNNGYITKDLFYSGHTSSMFMCVFLFPKKWDKAVALIASLAIGTMVILQHVHYTIDVLAAFPFTYIFYRIGKYWALK